MGRNDYYDSVGLVLSKKGGDVAFGIVNDSGTCVRMLDEDNSYDVVSALYMRGGAPTFIAKGERGKIEVSPLALPTWAYKAAKSNGLIKRSANSAFNVYKYPRTVEFIDELARKYGVSRSELSNLVYTDSEPQTITTAYWNKSIDIWEEREETITNIVSGHLMSRDDLLRAEASINGKDSYRSR